MTELPERPDLTQLRRRAKELHRAAAEGDPEGVRRLRAVSDQTTLGAAQLAVAREHGFPSWTSLRAAVEARRTNVVSALMPDKYRQAPVYGARDFLKWARTQGWSAGPLPVGAVFTSQTFITSHLEAHPEGYVLSDSLSPTNARVFMTAASPSVAIACLGVGAPAVVTLLENLVGLGVRSFIAVGPAPAVSPDLRWGDCVVLDRALRDDGISHHYVAPARYADADGLLTNRLLKEADTEGLKPRVGSAWTVPTPYRTTAEELAAYREEGVLVTDMSTAALFAVAAALGARAASAVVATRSLGSRKPARAPAPERRTDQVLTLIGAAISALQGDAQVPA